MLKVSCRDSSKTRTSHTSDLGTFCAFAQLYSIWFRNYLINRDVFTA